MRNYEVVVIVDPRLDEAAIQQAVEKFSKQIAVNGEVEKLEHWGRRRLAYEIEHLSEGYYVVASFRSEPTAIGELDRLFEIGEEYLRHKIVRLPEKPLEKAPA